MPSINVGNIDFDNVALGLTYIAGYRFNDWLFAGGGAEFNADVTGVKDFYLPVYGHIRTYFSKWIIRPYSSLSIGGFAGSHENYGNDSGFYGSFTVGADAHISDNLNMTLSCGLSNMGVMCQLGFSFQISIVDVTHLVGARTDDLKSNKTDQNNKEKHAIDSD